MSTKEDVKTTNYISKKILTFLVRAMIIKTIKVSDKGQIAIPRSIRELAGIETGDELIIAQDNGRILIEKADGFSEKMKDDFKDLLAFTSNSLKSVWGSKEDDVWNIYIKK